MVWADRMSAQIVPLITDAAVLWAAWAAARQRHFDHPTHENAAACCAAFKPYYMRAVGKLGFEQAMADERRACAYILEHRGQINGR